MGGKGRRQKKIEDFFFFGQVYMHCSQKVMTYDLCLAPWGFTFPFI